MDGSKGRYTISLVGSRLYLWRIVFGRRGRKGEGGGRQAEVVGSHIFYQYAECNILDTQCCEDQCRPNP